MLTNRQVADSWMRESDLDEVLSAERYEHVLGYLEEMVDAMRAEYRQRLADAAAARLTPEEREVLRNFCIIWRKQASDMAARILATKAALPLIARLVGDRDAD